MGEKIKAVTSADELSNAEFTRALDRYNVLLVAAEAEADGPVQLNEHAVLEAVMSAGVMVQPKSLADLARSFHARLAKTTTHGSTAEN